MTDLIISLFISSIGMGYFMYGKKAERYNYLLAGIILMVYPYFLHGIPGIILGLFLIVAPFKIEL